MGIFRWTNEDELLPPCVCFVYLQCLLCKRVECSGTYNILTQNSHTFRSLSFYIYMQEGRPDQRNASDAAALAAKVAKKEEMKKMEEGQEQRQTNSTVVRKKTNKKKEADLDDLLSAGLAKGKKK